MNNQVKIIGYRDFFDFPRLFYVNFDGHIYLFDCQFDENIDEYPDDFQVFRIDRSPEQIEQIPKVGWDELLGLQKVLIGKVATNSIIFDKSRKESVDITPILPL